MSDALVAALPLLDAKLRGFADADAVMTMAAREGLWAHGRSVDLRLKFMEYVTNQLAGEDDDEHECGCGCGCDHDEE